MDTKSFLTSRTLWGGVVLAAAFVVSKYANITPTAGEQAEAVDKLISAGDQIAALIGLILVWVGRIGATKQVTLTGK